MGRGFRVGIFGWTIITLGILYIFLKYAFPYLAMKAMDKENLLWVPSFLMAVYMILVILGVAIHIISDNERLEEFLSLIIKSLKGDISQRWVRTIVLAIVPLFGGFFLYSRSVSTIEPPSQLRIQHPTLPTQYERLKNPFRDPSPEIVKAFIEKEGSGNISIEEAKRLLVNRYKEEGTILFQKNCRPCHGVKADSDGPMIRGLRLKPIDFTDTGTIATIVEGYLFWRIKEGGIGLPPESTPWDSVMPRWKGELTDEEIWKIILAEYDIAGVEPRILEK